MKTAFIYFFFASSLSFLAIFTVAQVSSQEVEELIREQDEQVLRTLSGFSYREGYRHAIEDSNDYPELKDEARKYKSWEHFRGEMEKRGILEPLSPRFSE